MVINFENVEICHRDHPILKDVTIQVNEGELVYIVGPVGSGKTSLLRSFYGDLRPVSGISEVLDVDVRKVKNSKLPTLRRKIGMDFQDFMFLTDKTVGENLDFVLRATGWKDKNERRYRIVDVLEMVGLPDCINKYIHELSAGQRQLASIARALLNKPQLILADEPTCNLDSQNGETIVRLLDSLRQDGTAVIITTHNMTWPEMFPGTVYHCEVETLH